MSRPRKEINIELERAAKKSLRPVIRQMAMSLDINERGIDVLESQLLDIARFSKQEYSKHRITELVNTLRTNDAYAGNESLASLESAADDPFEPNAKSIRQRIERAHRSRTKLIDYPALLTPGLLVLGGVTAYFGAIFHNKAKAHHQLLIKNVEQEGKHKQALENLRKGKNLPEKDWPHGLIAQRDMMDEKGNYKLSEEQRDEINDLVSKLGRLENDLRHDKEGIDTNVRMSLDSNDAARTQFVISALALLTVFTMQMYKTCHNSKHNSTNEKSAETLLQAANEAVLTATESALKKLPNRIVRRIDSNKPEPETRAR